MCSLFALAGLILLIESCLKGLANWPGFQTTYPTPSSRSDDHFHDIMSGYEHSSQPYAQYQQGPPYVQAAPPPQGYPYAQDIAPQQNVYRQDPYLQHPSSYANTSQYAAQPPQAQGQYPDPPQTHPAFQSPTPAAPTKRGPVVFLFTHNETILNCQVDDPFGRTPFTITTEKKVTSFKASDGNPIARIEWDHSSPVMMYKGEKVKCREWLRVIHDKARGIQYVFQSIANCTLRRFADTLLCLGVERLRIKARNTLQLSLRRKLWPYAFRPSVLVASTDHRCRLLHSGSPLIGLTTL